jgi:hypothetical protein
MNHRVVGLIAFAALACWPADDGPTAEPEALVAVSDSALIPRALEAFLADEARAGKNASLRGSWGTTSRRFVTTAWHQHSGRYQEHRLSLLELAGDSIIERARDAGLGDAHWSDINVFVSAPGTLILGDVEDEYSYGLRAVLVTDDGRLVDLGLPEVAMPDTSEFGAMGPGSNALPHVTVFVVGGHFRLEFAVDLLRAPGSRDQQLICRVEPARPLVFQQSDSGWVTENAVALPAGGAEGAQLLCARVSRAEGKGSA